MTFACVACGFGIVLGMSGGALPGLLRPARLHGCACVLDPVSSGTRGCISTTCCRLVWYLYQGTGRHAAAVSMSLRHIRCRQHEFGEPSWRRSLVDPFTVRVPAVALRTALGEMTQLLLEGAKVRADQGAQRTASRSVIPSLAVALADLSAESLVPSH